MSSILFWVAALVAVTLLGPVIKLVVAAVAGKQIGARAIAAQPDQITLERANPSAWKHADAPRAIATALTSRGFQDAGTYTIAELPGVVIQLLVQTTDRLYAAVCEHPKAGTWFDLVTRFEDGSTSTYSTSPASLDPRPGHACVNMRGAQPLTVLDKALAMRPNRPIADVAVESVADVFRQSYAESIAYRKRVGVSTVEVVKIATRKAA